MKYKKKVIAFYLPQFYEFPENNEWWGKGFTEWTNVKKAKPLYKKHYQPTLPYNNNFYRLDDVETMRWQANLAKEYGVYGFCFYHYWFGSGRTLMEKPVENFLKERNIDIPFCMCWANHNWTRTWTGGDTDILMEVKYDGEDELGRHFEYLLPFFKDNRYIKIANKPVLLLYMPELIPNLEEMKKAFMEMSIDNGFDGIVFVSQAPEAAMASKKYSKNIDYFILYEPNYTQLSIAKKLKKRQVVTALKESPNTVFHVGFNALKKRINRVFYSGRKESLKTNYFSYDGTWKAILKRNCDPNKYMLGAFVGFDNSPRKNYAGTVFKGKNPESFAKYFHRFIKMAMKKNNNDYVFIMAWNEWGEGAYLEPDDKNGYKYLEGIKNAVL